MKKLLTATAILLLFACGKKADETRVSDTSDTGVTTGTNATAPASPAEVSTVMPTDTGSIDGSPQPTGTSATNIPANATATPPAGNTSTATPNTNTNPPADAAPAPTNQIADGQSIYRGNCESCHGADGKKPAGGKTLVSAATQAKSSATLVHDLSTDAAHKSLRLGAAQLESVVAYVKALK